MNLRLSLVTILFCGWINFAFASDFVTKGDIRKSSVESFKSFFTKEKCDQILIDTFTICYDHERKSPTAVYVEVTGPTVVEDIDKRPPFFTDKRVEKDYRKHQKTIRTQVTIEVILVHQMLHMIGTKSIRKQHIQWLTSYRRHHSLIVISS